MTFEHIAHFVVHQETLHCRPSANAHTHTQKRKQILRDYHHAASCAHVKILYTDNDFNKIVFVIFARRSLWPVVNAMRLIADKLS